MTDRSRSSAIRWILALGAGGLGLVAGAYWHAPLLRLVGAGTGAPTAAARESSQVTGEVAPATQLWTCGMHPQVIQDHPGTCPICHMALVPLQAGSTARDGHAVQIDPAIVQNMGVRLVTVAAAPLTQTVRVTATVVEPETARVDINLRVSGWIEMLHANIEGMEIKKGEPLFDLYSPEITQAIEELIAARRASSGGGDSTASLVKAAQNRLLIQGLTAEQVEALGAIDHAPRAVTFVSPIDGTLVDKMGTNTGSAVYGGQLVLRLVDRSTMWIEGRVPEGQLAHVAIGNTTRVRVSALPGRPLDGSVVFVHPRLDEGTRTGMVRVAVANTDGLLRAGMYATMDIDAGKAEPTLQIPREAVIDSGDSQIALVGLGGGRFEPRELRLGRSGDHGLVEVLAGLSAGDEVVASGQFLIDSESRLREAIAKFLDHSHAATGASGGGSMPTAANEPDSPAPRTHVPTRWAPASGVDAVVEAYLPLAEVLGAEQTRATPVDCDPLVRAIHALHGQVSAAEGVTLILDAAKAAEAMKGQTLDAQRETFKVLSNAMIALVDAMPPSPEVANSLYVVHCPMALGNWLQRTRDVANPYYATEMKACGTVVRPIGEAKGGN